jgi:histidyl-tRNA synthetase
VAGAPALLDHLDAESQRHFERLQELLTALGIAYEVNSRLVRGLDYYNRTVFEWVTDRLGAQGTVCAGGRYDGLVEQLGGRATPAVGFAVGLERLIALVANGGRVTVGSAPHVYLAMAGDLAERSGLVLAERLRDALPDLRLLVNSGGGGFKTQLKRADRSGARLVLILGDDEISQGWTTVKFLRTEDEQVQLPPDDLPAFLRTHLDLAGTP